MAEAAAEARRARLPAIAAFIAAEADAKERQAEQLDADAAMLEARANRLRKALNEHDDWGHCAAQGRSTASTSRPFRARRRRRSSCRRCARSAPCAPSW